MKATKWLGGFLLLCSWALITFVYAQKPATEAAHLSDEAKVRLLSSYKSALIAQTNAALAQQKLQLAIQSFQALAEKEAAAGKFPKGTTFQVNVDTDEVTAIEPQKKDEKKPDEKK